MFINKLNQLTINYVFHFLYSIEHRNFFGFIPRNRNASIGTALPIKSCKKRVSIEYVIFPITAVNKQEALCRDITLTERYDYWICVFRDNQGMEGDGEEKGVVERSKRKSS